MAEKLLEKQTCQACGANVRRNAQFCYNCGSEIVPETKTEIGAENGNNNEIPKPIEDNSQLKTTQLEESNLNPVIKANVPPDTSIKKDDIKTASPSETKLKSAAELRQKATFAPKKFVEVTWDEPETAPSILFIAVAVFLTLFAVGILFAMLYVR